MSEIISLSVRKTTEYMQNQGLGDFEGHIEVVTEHGSMKLQIDSDEATRVLTQAANAIQAIIDRRVRS